MQTPWKVDGDGSPWIVIDTGFEATESRYVVGSFQSLHDAEEVVATRNACVNAGLKRVAEMLAACEALERLLLEVALPGPVHISIAEGKAIVVALEKAKS